MCHKVTCSHLAGGLYMRAFITIISYWALLFLTTSSSRVSITGTLVLLFLGPVLLLWKKPWKPNSFFSRSTILISVIVTVYLGFHFYNEWTPAIYTLINSGLPISNTFYRVLVIVAAVCGSVFGTYFCAGLLEQAKNLIFSPDEAQLFKRDLLSCFLIAAITVILAQNMIGIYFLSMGHLKFFCAALIVSATSLLLYGLLGNLTVSAALVSGLCMIISTANVYVYAFRGRLFDPVDIMSTTAALNVVGNYDILSSLPRILPAWLIWVGSLVCINRSCATRKSAVPRPRRIILSVCCVVLIIPLYIYASGLRPYRWNTQGAREHGYILNYISKIQEISVDPPSGYHPEHIAEITEKYLPEADESDNDQPPHIIVIMNETFADLSVFSPLKTNAEVTPFISNLRENAISGYALTSIHGGNTANSEYEFLTGNSMAWLPPNSVPYQQYIKGPTSSMVSYLKSNYNYRCVAMHPYHSSGWNRSIVYPVLGFDEYYFLEDFTINRSIRSYASDEDMFRKIVDTYEGRGSDPLFLFGVTMQNHGPYVGDVNEIEQIVPVGYSRDYPDATIFLSLMHETDKAVKNLLSYFEQVEDDVIIVFFGDHQPKVSEDFYQEISGNTFSTLDQQQKRYLVPFFVWANYDIEEQYVEETSLNYLSSYVYDAAGIPLPPYNQFLSEMENIIPAINVNGFYSLHSGSYLSFEMASEEERSWLDTYEHLQYNNVFDIKNRDCIFFPVSE